MRRSCAAGGRAPRGARLVRAGDHRTDEHRRRGGASETESASVQGRRGIHIGRRWRRATPRVRDREKEIGEGGSLGLFLHTSIPFIYMAYSECLPTRLNPLRLRGPLSPRYAMTKVWAETLGELYARVHGLSVVLARIGWFVLAAGEPVIKCPSPLKVLKDTYHYSCY